MTNIHAENTGYYIGSQYLWDIYREGFFARKRVGSIWAPTIDQAINWWLRGRPPHV